jgi:hypothetical protein
VFVEGAHGRVSANGSLASTLTITRLDVHSSDTCTHVVSCGGYVSTKTPLFNVQNLDMEHLPMTPRALTSPGQAHPSIPLFVFVSSATPV